jgi:hypothetical protein
MENGDAKLWNFNLQLSGKRSCKKQAFTVAVGRYYHNLG